MNESVYHPTTPAQAQRRKELAPGVHDAFQSFSKAVFAHGALPEKTKQLIAVAVAHVTQLEGPGHLTFSQPRRGVRLPSWSSRLR